MTDKSTAEIQDSGFNDTYYYRSVWVTSTVAGCSLLLAVFVFVFLHAQLVPHALYDVYDPVKEMTGYAELFLLTFASYYLAGFLVYWKRSFLSRFSQSLVPIVTIGTLIFSTYSSIRLSNTLSDELISSFIFCFVVISLVTGTGCAIASAYRGDI